MSVTDLSRDNSLVQLVARGARVSPWFVAILVTSALLGGVAQFVAPFSVALPQGNGLVSLLEGVVAFLTPLVAQPLGELLRALSQSLYQTYLMPLYMLVGFALAAFLLMLWVRCVEVRPFHSIGFTTETALPGIVLGIVLALLLTTVVMLSFALGGMLQPRVAAPGTVGVAALGGVLFLALAFTVQSSAEEMIYRGWLMNVLAFRHGVPVGIIVNMTLFALAHSQNNGFGVLAAGNLLLFALFLSLLALRTGSLWASCAWHATWNWTIANIWGVAISGEPPDGGSLMAWTTTGPVLWTGGDWGPEGGLITTIVLASGSLFLLGWGGLKPVRL